jgi:hypothetical protein
MTNPTKCSSSDDLAAMVMTMPEPLGRLGAIVRRLKQMPPVPPPLARETGTSRPCESGE